MTQKTKDDAPADGTELIDSHCHIHEATMLSADGGETQSRWAKSDEDIDIERIIARAVAAGVIRMICIGTTLPDSKRAVELAQEHDRLWASIGLHPHEGSVYVHDHRALQQFRDLASKPKVIAVGECGLDYYYNHSSKADQIKLLRFQLDIALEHNLPVVFHVREAFDDFWPIFDSYGGKIRGVLHSYTDNLVNLQKGLDRGLYIGVNGIATFNKDAELQEVHRTIPADRLLLETDAPFLTPAPDRGKVCEPSHVRVTAEFLAKFRDESLDALAKASTDNARHLFGME